MRVFLLLLIVTFSGCATIRTQNDVAVNIENYGIINTHGEKTKVVDPSHPAGYYTTSSDNWNIVATVDLIPMIQGIEFGVLYTVTSNKAINVIERVIFPKNSLINPANDVQKEFSQITNLAFVL